MHKVSKLLTCLAVVLLPARPTTLLGQEDLQFTGAVADVMDPNGGWQHASGEEVKGQYAIDEWVPKGDSIENWTRLFTMQNFARTKRLPRNPKGMMTGLREFMEKRCPGVTWEVVRESDNDILYQWHFENCSGNPDQQELTRILYGRWNIWRLAYSRKGSPMDEQERSRWIDALSKPTIIGGGKR